MAKVEKKARTPAKPRQKKNGYKFPDKLPVGEVLKDLKKAEWVLGPSIGKGGFGEIYSAKEAKSKGSNYSYVVKIEPHENGPLFVENHFYLKVAKPEDVKEWSETNGLKSLGIPSFHGLGSHDYNGQKYRFLVIERYGKDLWSLFLENDKKFSNDVVWRYAVQIINVLEYIHCKGYVHADIKGANLLLGLKKGTENNIFLVDFGLACKYSDKEFKRDPKKAHNGTIEYTSRDWHNGVPTRRGDMEILGFNLLHWVNSSLPWEDVLSTPVKVQEKKEELMTNISSSMKQHFSNVPKVLVSYLEYVASLKHNQAPDYDFCRSLFDKAQGSASSVASPMLRNGKSPRVSRATPKKKLAGQTPSPVKPKRRRVDVRKKKAPSPTPVSDGEEEASAGDGSEEVESPDMFEVKKKTVGRKRVVKSKVVEDIAESPPKQAATWRDAPAIIAGSVAKPAQRASPQKAVRKTRSNKSKQQT